MILSTYPMLLQLANVLPRKTVVDVSRGSRKQLRKTASHKRKAESSIAILNWRYYQEKAFDAETFKRYVAEWIVACDQPFEEVERPEFRRLLEYTHMGSKPLDIPHIYFVSIWDMIYVLDQFFNVNSMAVSILWSD